MIPFSSGYVIMNDLIVSEISIFKYIAGYRNVTITDAAQGLSIIVCVKVHLILPIRTTIF